MNYLSVNKVTKSLGERVLFENISFGLNRGEKSALIAGNGTGKSSLLKIITGKDTPDSGEVSFRNGIRWAYLEQDPGFTPGQSISDLIENANSDIRAVIDNYQKVLMKQDTDADAKLMEEAMAEMDRFHAWDYERELTTILSKFELYDTSAKVDSLSGGQRKRLALALVLLDNPDLLILDEPTNHLDVELIEWLEEYLSQKELTLLMVTHDRYFLDRVCNNIIEMSEGKIYHHKGNYSYFLEKKAEREEVQNIEIAKAGKLMKKELEWIRRQPKARGTKSKSRIDAFEETKAKANSGKVQKELKLEVKMTRVGGKILEMKKVRKSYGDKLLLNGFDYTFKKGERIGIVGKNGVGKSTFLNIITQQEQADSGKLNQGETIVYGYYSQEGLALKEDKRVIEVLRDVAEYIEMSDGSKISASQFLQQFLFNPDLQYSFVSKLSGGEKRRLHLLMTLIKNPNFLILDEPTNDLDLLTLNKLEDFLSNYRGCLVLVSHDRYFMDKLVDHLFIFEGEGVIRDFNGTYSEYREEKEELEKEEKRVSRQEKKQVVVEKPKIEEPAKRKFSFKEKLEFETLEAEIQELEKEKALLEKEINSGEAAYEMLAQKADRIGKLIQMIDEKSLRWLELSELSD